MHRHLVAKTDSAAARKRVADPTPAARQIAAFREAADDALPTKTSTAGSSC